MSLFRPLLGCWLALSIAACERAKPPEPSAPVPAAPRVISPSLSSSSAFELVASSQGLRLLWALESSAAGWLQLAELGQDGAPRAAPRSLPVPARTLRKVTDLAAAQVGEELALAWLEQGNSEARAIATFTAEGASVQLMDLGAAALVAESARGNLALVAEPEQGRAVAMWRGLTAPCISPQPAPCTAFTFRRLRPGSAEATGLPLSVPVPCASHSVQLSASNGRFQYGVCTREGAEPVTTMFSIQYEPEYARAEPLLKGCLPLGTVEAGERPWLIADCHGKRRAAPIPGLDEQVVAEPLDAPQITCTPERAEVRQGRFVLQLREPRARLESVLPASFVPSGGRAGWTGRSLVVASVTSGRLEARAFACLDGKLQPL
ncbi:MAG: hypothetical protein EOO73_07695 [Myxococcales bacterium]|nr:MAG: hypothetical protein EOO73_07695 [Myxococcales bacterium]